MKTFFTAASALVLTATVASAASLFLDLGPTTATGAALTNDPAHVIGGVSTSETSWNTVTTSSDFTTAVYSDGTSATGVTIDFGQSAAAGTSINFATTISNTGLLGTGGANPGVFFGASSIYGASSATSTAVGRDGFFGAADTAIGMRIDGLMAGQYTIYVMARNTNSNQNGQILPMNLFTSVGASSTSFSFSGLTPTVQTNTGSNSAATYASYVAGENYVAIGVTVGSGESLFIASDGGGTELRGFINSVQIVPVPEPSTCAASMLGFLVIAAIVRGRNQA